MPLFYFDIVQIDGTFRKDTVGVDLLDAPAAREEAKRCLVEMSEEAVNQDLSELRSAPHSLDRRSRTRPTQAVRISAL